MVIDEAVDPDVVTFRPLRQHVNSNEMVCMDFTPPHGITGYNAQTML